MKFMTDSIGRTACDNLFSLEREIHDGINITHAIGSGNGKSNGIGAEMNRIRFCSSITTHSFSLKWPDDTPALMIINEFNSGMRISFNINTINHARTT